MKIIFFTIVLLVIIQCIFGQSLSQIYNSNVIKAERWKRPFASSAPRSWFQYVVSHSGVVVTLKNGSKYLVHKGNEYGIASQTVVVSANYMSSAWSLVSQCNLMRYRTVGDYVRAGGATYSIFFDNCNHASTRMMNLCY